MSNSTTLRRGQMKNGETIALVDKTATGEGFVVICSKVNYCQGRDVRSWCRIYKPNDKSTMNLTLEQATRVYERRAVK